MDKPRYQSAFLARVASVIRTKHYSIRTEQAYIDWIRRFILFHGKRHPGDMGEREVVAFLTHLAVQRNVAASTQNQALNALVFMYKEVLEQPLNAEMKGIVHAKRPKRLPVVLTAAEVAGILSQLQGTQWLVACLLYGSGLRLIEAVRLRVMDLDFDRRAILVRNGKGAKDRVVTLADELIRPLQRHLQNVKTTHERDLEAGFGCVHLPHALNRKYPNACREWGWQYVFPASRRGIDPRTGKERRHHIDASVIQKAVRAAVRRAGSQLAASSARAATRPNRM